MSLITRYGIDNFMFLLAVGVAFSIGAYLLRQHVFLSIVMATFGIVVIVFAFWFFRDPKRQIPQQARDPRCVIAPADGKVVQITAVTDSEYIHGRAIQISIFLSPLDVHVNRYPVSGVVEYVRYYPGAYLVAWHPKSSELNERCVIGVRTVAGKVLFRQITGILARRIVFETALGDTVAAGDRFGMMKFGSRMDVLVPEDSQVIVKQGDRVRAAESIIAWLPSQHP